MINIFGAPLSSTVVTAIIAVAVLLVFIVFMSLLTKWIVKVPPDKALIVFGVGTKSTVPVYRKKLNRDKSTSEKPVYDLVEEQAEVSFKIVRGGAALVIPAFMQSLQLDLSIMTLEVEVADVLSKQAVPITVDGIAQVKIGGDMAFICTAAELLLNKNVEDLTHAAEETLKGHMRSIIGLMTVEETFTEREAFSTRVQDVAVQDMAGMGFQIVSFVIKSISDKKGYIDALGAPEIQTRLKLARMAVANNTREARQVEAEQDLAARTAELDRDRNVFAQTEATNLREVQKNQNVALANQEKDRQVAEKQALAVAQQKQAELIVPAEAERTSKKVIAEGEQYRIEVTAKANANATVTTATAAADATKLAAGAQAEATRVTRTAEGDGLKAVRLAEAAGTEANLLAEAKGKKEIAAATAAQGEVNLRQLVAQLLIEAQKEIGVHAADAVGQIGANVKLVQIGNLPAGQNSLLGMLQQAPGLAVQLNEQVKALTNGMSIEQILAQVLNTLKTAGDATKTEANAGSSAESATPTGENLTGSTEPKPDQGGGSEETKGKGTHGKTQM